MGELKITRKLSNSSAFFSHIILGFTRDGQHLISYQCRVDALHTYSLHWWRFNLRSPLRHVHYEELFRGEKIEQDLHLIVCQTPDDGSVVVLGSTLGLAEDDCRSCYISVLPSCNPEDTTRKPSSTFHIKYELLPPYPPFSPSLSLSLTGTIPAPLTYSAQTTPTPQAV